MKRSAEGEPAPPPPAPGAPPDALDEASPRLAYRRRKGERKTTLHWGQRKLLMSEVEFLTRYSAPAEPHTVVYAGAAPGTHVGYLAELFPQHEFVLVDPNPFDVARRCERIATRQEYFCTALARELRAESARRGRRVLFISDIRTADWKTQAEEDYRRYLEADNAAQAEWAREVGAAHAMLKFSLPYGEGTTRYLKGKVYLPVWGPQTTTECRLVVDASGEEADYSHKRHEEQMFYFNTVLRCTVFSDYAGVPGEGFDGRYDCAREIDILRAYLRAHRPAVAAGGLDDEVAVMSAEISRVCSKKGFTLRTHPLNPFSLPRTAGNEDGQKRRCVEAVAVRRVAHPCSAALTESGGGRATSEHMVLTDKAAVVRMQKVEKEKEDEGAGSGSGEKEEEEGKAQGKR